ncbi:MAG: 3-phosphoshikimate 1-carboxyvinyltransferase, partial [Desulfovibrio sp.]|nr:3-phosphoshikimate 1-carboxyvinyltransferase [Desulfovibrio sp.]
GAAARVGRTGGQPQGAAAALIDLDRDLMKLLVRRSTLVSRMRGGKDNASTPAAIQAEKAVRVAGEAGALAFSRDPRFSRQLFALLQDIKVMGKAEAQKANSFRLTPSKAAVNAAITGPTSSRGAQMRLALAAALGRPLVLEGVTLSPALLDAARALAQAGAAITHESTGSGIGRVSLQAGGKFAFTNKTLYVGDDLFTLYLLAFMAVGKTGACRFNGGARLKAADLSPLRQALPLFGARLAHVIPRSQGAPANVESSGYIPPLVVVPADLPLEGICALLLAPLAWGAPLTLNLAALPAVIATAALSEVRPLHREVGAEVETQGPHLVFTPGPLQPPSRPLLPLEPALAAYLLALPAFSGGSFTLYGRWPSSMPEAQEAEQLLAFAGLSLSHGGRADGEESVTSSRLSAALDAPLHGNDISSRLGPLLLALCAHKKATGAELPPLDGLPFPQDDVEKALAGEFFARAGFYSGAAGLEPAPAEDGEAPAWTSPDPYWSMAYALAAFHRPGLRLANPGNIGEVLPFFWNVYNGLPEPSDPARQPPEKTEETSDRPARRRIIAGGPDRS